MTLFASPDFGASGMYALHLLIFFLELFMLIGIAGALLIRSFRSRRKVADGQQRSQAKPSPVAEFFRILLCCAVVSVLGTYFLPRPIFSLYYGRSPADSTSFHIAPGMTEEEVVSRYGQPHAKYEEGDGESWNYHTDNWGCGISIFNVQFDRKGRVTSCSYH